MPQQGTTTLKYDYNVRLAAENIVTIRIRSDGGQAPGKTGQFILMKSGRVYFFLRLCSSTRFLPDKSWF